MNIAYTLKLLGDEPVPYVHVGRDFDGHYAAHLAALGVDTSGVQITDASHCAHAFIFTDRDQNQFTGFFGGPPVGADFEARIERFASGFDFAVLAPDVPEHMIPAARALRRVGVPFLTDPGQNLTDFEAADAEELTKLSEAIVVNEFEHETLRKLARRELDEVDLVIVTQGERGTRWRCRSEGDGHEGAVAARIVDPTGCGDAFRGGFVHARLKGAAIADAVRAGGVTAALALEVSGTQSHRCDGFATRYRNAWDTHPPWLDSP